MTQALEEQLFQVRLFAEINRYLTMYQIPAEKVTAALGISSEEWQRLVAGLQPITVFQLHRCAETIGTSYHLLLPDAVVVKPDLLMAMAVSLPADLFNQLYDETVRFFQHSARRSQIANPRYVDGVDSVVTP